MLRSEDKAVHITAEANDIKPQICSLSLGRRRGAGKAVDGDVFDRCRINILDPAGSQVCRQRLLGRHLHDIEMKTFRTATFVTENRLGFVVEREAVRSGKREAERRMQETPAADEALARI